jgi:CDP-diacylglycerol---glycerol-3-phosphate 3-phosphatidyltransferase
VNQSLVSGGLRERVRGLATPVALAFGRLGLTPNAPTVIGFVGTCVAAYAAATQAWLLAGVLVLAFGIFDLFDGALARATGRASKFGAFLDSTLDRTGENLLYAGVAFGCLWAAFPLGTLLAALAMAFASVVTYTRAKAEVLGLHGEVGLAPREVRVAVLSVGLITAGLSAIGDTAFPNLSFITVFDWGSLDLEAGQGFLALALGLIALLSAITVIQRIIHIRRQLDTQQQENQ